MADAPLFEAWSPVTRDFGLVRGDHAEVADAYAALFAGTADLRRSNLDGGLAEAFGALAPLTHAMSRQLFLATPCGWTAFFQNGTQGSDPFLIILRLA